MSNLSQYKLDSINAIKDIDTAVIKQIIEEIKNASRVFVFGNGGSATTASHFALDCTKNARHPVMCLNDSTGMITAYANDESFNDIFSLQLAHINDVKYESDLVIGISTSGNSGNVYNGIGLAYSYGMTTIALTGFDGGKIAEFEPDIHLHINSDVIEAVEDAHLAALHMVVRGLKDG